MNSRKFIKYGSLVLAVALIISLFSAVGFAEEKRTKIKFGVAPYTDALSLASLLNYMLEERLDMDVNIINTNLGASYQAVATKSEDLHLTSWLPETHKNYWEKVASDVTVFGIIHEHAEMCWAVPDYVPKEKLDSIPDMGKPEVKEKLNGKIFGISAGAGEMQISEKMMEEYEALDDYNLIPASDVSMVAQLDRKIKRDEWAVVTLWRPHFAWNRYDIRCLKHPKGFLGTEERSQLIGRNDFVDIYPDKVSTALSRFWLPIEKVDELTEMYGEYEEATGKKFAEKYPEMMDYWVNGYEAIRG